jgi:predicted small lipoprotein YifL
MNAQLTATLVAALLVSVLAGCGDKGPDSEVAQPASPAVDTAPEATSGKSSARNPCELVTDAEVGALVGATVTRTREVEENRGKTCEWEFPNSGPLGTGTAIISAWHGRGFYTPDTVPEGFTAVPGIGDVAHRDQTMLIFRKGEEVIGVHVTGQFTADMDVEVAKLVMSKL